MTSLTFSSSAPFRAAPTSLAAHRQTVPSQTIPVAARQAPISRAVITGIAAASDSAAILLSGMIAAWLGLQSIDPGARPFAAMGCLAATLAMANLLGWTGAQRFDVFAAPRRALGLIALEWILVAAAITGFARLEGIAAPAIERWLGEWSLAALGYFLASRLFLSAMIRRWRAEGRLSRITAIVGAGSVSEKLIRQQHAQPDQGFQVVGIYDDRLGRLPDRCAGYPVLGTVDDLIRDVREGKIDTVIVALPLSADWRMAEVMNKLGTVAVETVLCPDHFGFHIGQCSTAQMGDLTLLRAAEVPLRDWRQIAKDWEDRILGGLILAMISPVLLVIAIAIKLDSPGPVFFKQKRTGYNNRLIEVWKFRSMYAAKCDANAETLTTRNDPRVTKLGAFIRRTSLDELPQFINVVRGEMSIVGPRPHALSAKAGGLVYQDAVKYYDARHRVKPGITGWAQVNGWRGETETVEQIAKRVEHDLFYIAHWSILLDLKIILRTIFGGFTGHKAY